MFSIHALTALRKPTIHKLCALSHGCISRAECEILAATLLTKDRAWIIAHPEQRLSYTHVLHLLWLIWRRRHGVPLAYLTGTKEFYGRAFRVTQNTLVPRPESELLIDLACRTAQETTAAQIIFLDIGTGSGNLITTVTCHCKDHSHATFLASDVSRAALRVAQHNAKRHTTKHIHFYKSDLLQGAALREKLRTLLAAPHTHLVIIANLPYVDSAHRETLLSQPLSHGLAHEPAMALWSDDHGLAHYTRLLTQTAALAQSMSQVEITSLYEIDPTQEGLLTQRIHSHFPAATPHYHNDLAGKARVCTWTLPARK